MDDLSLEQLEELVARRREEQAKTNQSSSSAERRAATSPAVPTPLIVSQTAIRMWGKDYGETVLSMRIQPAWKAMKDYFKKKVLSDCSQYIDQDMDPRFRGLFYSLQDNCRHKMGMPITVLGVDGVADTTQRSSPDDGQWESMKLRHCDYFPLILAIHTNYVPDAGSVVFAPKLRAEAMKEVLRSLRSGIDREAYNVKVQNQRVRFVVVTTATSI
jgi:hypothetical protein